MVALEDVLFLSISLFAIGIYGIISKRNGLGILVSAEIIINASLLNFVAASSSFLSFSGVSYALLVLVMAVLEAVAFMGLLIAYYRKTSSVSLSKLRNYRG
jgi:NADH-quinone oxidoreductase subunit K